MHTWMPELKSQCHLETLGKREIFKGFGIFECIAVAIALGIGYLLTLFVPSYKLKVIL